MWNVFGYCKQFINEEVEYLEFLNIYDRQFQLRDFISDMQKDLDKNRSSKEIIDNFRKSKDYINLRKYIKELVTNFEKVHK